MKLKALKDTKGKLPKPISHNTRSFRAGESLGKSIIEMVHLFYGLS